MNTSPAISIPIFDNFVLEPTKEQLSACKIIQTNTEFGHALVLLAPVAPLVKGKTYTGKWTTTQLVYKKRSNDKFHGNRWTDAKYTSEYAMHQMLRVLHTAKLMSTDNFNSAWHDVHGHFRKIEKQNRERVLRHHATSLGFRVVKIRVKKNPKA